MSNLTLTSRLAILACSTAIVTAAYAQEGNTCYAPDGVTEISCPVSNSDVAVGLQTGANSERATTTAGTGFDDIGFSISIEETTIEGAAKPRADQRIADRALKAVDVQVKFDGLDVVPRLNVSTSDLRASYRGGEPIRFRASTNYPAWIARAEVVIYDRAARVPRPLTVLPVAPNGSVDYVMPGAGPAELSYVLRVYDAQGRYNETAPLRLDRTTEAFDRHQTVGTSPIAAGEGKDRTAVANIPVHGGSVTTIGAAVAPGTTVRVMGENAIVDESGRFVMQRILPPGQHLVDVNVLRGGETVEHIGRDIEIPESEWFYVGIADLTITKQIEDELEGTIVEQDGVDVDGRLAFYLKGRVKARTLITASADTGDGDLEDIFERLDDKDPRQVLRRLDPQDTYLVYGDDSTAYDDTPSSGRFYIRVERDNSSATWGDFDTDISSGQLINTKRRLYGAQLDYQSNNVTPRGEAKFSAEIYAAQPDTRPQQDVLRGTGGSAYFLSQQDINGASENIRVEIIDRETGRVIERRVLTAGRDYSIDYVQGVLILTDPLSSTATTGSVVSDSAIGDYDVNLVVDYEYTPGLDEVGGDSFGGSAEAWVTDDLNLKVAALKDTTDTAEIENIAATLRYQFGDNSWVEGEIAQSKGRGLGANYSTDGGLSFNLVSAGDADDEGSAFRLETFIDYTDLGGARPGHFGAYIERREAGFATLNSTLEDDETITGLYGATQPSELLELRYDARQLKRGTLRDTEVSVELAYRLNDQLTLEAGLQHSDQTGSIVPREVGERTDLGLRLTYAYDEDREIYVFGQGTLSTSGGRSENNRLGVGGSVRLSEKLTASGEISDGTRGIGALAKLSYSPTADNEIYFGYTLDPSRTISGHSLSGRDRGVAVFGAKYRYSERFYTFAENTFDLFGDRRSVTEAYGVSYTPDARWTYTGGLEVGSITDPNDLDFDRRAVSFGVSYVPDDKTKGNLRLEYRDEDGTGLTRDRETFLLSGGYEYKVSDDWRFLATLDAVVSESDQSAFRDGRYIEAGVGYAYRPVLNERLNALVKLSYLEDLPGEDQANADGDTDGVGQRSLVFSGDVIYDLNEKLSIGGKYGFRLGEVESTRAARDFTDSTAHLAIVRADWHVVHKWDVLGELRYLYTEESGTRERGALAGIYRHVGNNAKIGLGYEWGSVSDDVADLDYDSSGIFLNIIAKF